MFLDRSTFACMSIPFPVRAKKNAHLNSVHRLHDALRPSRFQCWMTARADTSTRMSVFVRSGETLPDCSTSNLGGEGGSLLQEDLPAGERFFARTGSAPNAHAPFASRNKRDHRSNIIDS